VPPQRHDAESTKPFSIDVTTVTLECAEPTVPTTPVWLTKPP
jgi:hypothetical protein